MGVNFVDGGAARGNGLELAAYTAAENGAALNAQNEQRAFGAIDLSWKSEIISVSLRRRAGSRRRKVAIFAGAYAVIKAKIGISFQVDIEKAGTEAKERKLREAHCCRQTIFPVEPSHVANQAFARNRNSR